MDYTKKRKNTCGIITTHFLKDIEIYCDKLGLVENGQFLCIDYLKNIKKNLGGYNLIITDLNQIKSKNLIH